MGNNCVVYEKVNSVLTKYGVNYTFNRGEDILNRAFTHSSVADDKKDSYEKLAFLGDSVLKTIVTNYLHSTFPDANRCVLARLRIGIENNDMLVKLSKEVGLSELVKFEVHNRELVRRIYADVFESFIGAVFEIAGFDVCTRLVIAIIEKEIDIPKLHREIRASEKC